MAKTPQRNINLSNKLVSLVMLLLESSQALLGPEDLGTERLKELEDRLYDTAGAIREHRRKVSPFEVKGQRL